MASPFPPRATDATYADNLGTEFITIYVGPERKQYGVHKNLLTSQSDYFEKALNGGFKEAGEGSIHLEEDDPAAIALLIGWLYRGVIPGPAAQSVDMEGAFPPSTIDKVVLPAGGTSVEVDIHAEHDQQRAFGQASDLSCFQTILCHPRYRDYSSEELRLADYNEGRKYKASSELSSELEHDIGPDTSSSGMHGRSAAARGLHVWPAPTLPGVHGSMPVATVATGGFGAFPPQGGAGFGSTPLLGGGIGGVAQSAVSHFPPGGGLFGNPMPTGSTLFGPSTVASSGGVFVNLGTQSQTSSGGLFGNPSQTSSGGLFGGLGSQMQPSSGVPFGGLGQQSQPSTGGIFGNLRPPTSQQHSVSPFGQLGSQAQGQPSSSAMHGLQSALLPGNPVTSPLLPTTDPFFVNPSTATSAPQPASSSSLFENPSAGSVASVAPSNPGMPALTAAVKSALNIPGDASTSQASSTPTTTPQQPPLNSNDSSFDEDDAGVSRVAMPRPSDNYQPSSGAQLGQSDIPSSASTSTTPIPTPNPPSAPAPGAFFSFPSNPPLPPNPFPFPPQAQSNASFSFPYRESGCLPLSSASISEFSRFNPSGFNTTSQNPFGTTFSTYTTPSHQLALLNLTLFAETTCWPTLYNASITSYISGERTLTRPPPLEHVTLIYERTHDESSLRRWAVDSLAAHKGDVDMSGYMGLLVDYEGFLEGVLKKLREKGQQGNEPGPGWDGAGGLTYRMLEHGKKNPFGGGKDKGKGKASGSFGMKDR